MSEKGIGILVAAAFIVPLCAVCILGPVVLGSAVAWAAGWFSGFGAVVATGLAVIVGLAVYGLARRNSANANSQRLDKPAE